MAGEAEDIAGAGKRPGSPGNAEMPLSPAAKLFAALEVFARTPSIGVTALAERLGLPKATVHRILSQLEEIGYVQREPGGRLYSGSPALVSLAADILGSSLRQAPRHGILRDLSDRVGETCSLGLRVGYEVVYIDAVTVTTPLAIHFKPGRRAPLYCTSIGKLYLAEMREQDLETYLRHTALEPLTDETITDPERLRGVVEAVRRDGFAISAEEFVLGVSGAAVPVRSRSGQMLAGLTVSIPSVRIDMAGLENLREPLTATARRLTAALSD